MNVDEAMKRWREYPNQKKSTVTDLFVAEIERLRSELAAAKAASKCPVKLFWCYESNGCDIVISGMSDEDSTKFGNWLNQRMKDTTPPTT